MVPQLSSYLLKTSTSFASHSFRNSNYWNLFIKPVLYKSKHHIPTMTASQPKQYEFKFSPIISTEENSTDRASLENLFSLRFVTYNILGQVYTKSVNFPYSPKGCLKWNLRSKAILQLFLQLDADVFCLQELDEFCNFYHPFFEKNGYGSVYVKRPGKKKDGCAIVYKKNKFDLIDFSPIDYNDLIPSLTNQQVQNLPIYVEEKMPVSLFIDGKLHEEGEERSEKEEKKGFSCTENTSFSFQNSNSKNVDLNDPRIRFKRDCVASMAALQSKQNKEKCLVIASSHLYWNPECIDVKLAQSKYLLYSFSFFARKYFSQFGSNLHMMIGGDFNSQPGDQVYNFLTSKQCVHLLNDKQNKNNSSIGEFTSSDEGVNGLDAQSIHLQSVYAFTGGEPPHTTHTKDFTGTLDYVFFAYRAGMDLTSRIELPPLSDESMIGGVPNFYHPSDHLPIGVEMNFL